MSRPQLLKLCILFKLPFKSTRTSILIQCSQMLVLKTTFGVTVKTATWNSLRLYGKVWSSHPEQGDVTRPETRASPPSEGSQPRQSPQNGRKRADERRTPWSCGAFHGKPSSSMGWLQTREWSPVMQESQDHQHRAALPLGLQQDGPSASSLNKHTEQALPDDKKALELDPRRHISI